MTAASQQGPVVRECGRALIAGYMDAYALASYGVFTTFMSGNTITTGVQSGNLRWQAAAHDFLPIPIFVLGCCAGALLNTGPQSKKGPVRSMLVVTALSALCTVMALLRIAPAWWIALLALTMGIFATTASRVGHQTVNFGFVTGDLKSLGEQLASAWRSEPLEDAVNAEDTPRRRLALLFGVWLFFLVGAVVDTLLMKYLHAWTLTLPTLGLAVLTCVDSRTVKRSEVATRV